MKILFEFRFNDIGFKTKIKTAQSSYNIFGEFEIIKKTEYILFVNFFKNPTSKNRLTN